jgi:uncharacterized phage infection (PIP) family protein YhgE
MKNFKIATLTTLVIMTLSGCADKTPTTADFMRMHAQDEKDVSLEQRALAKEWDRGSNLKQLGEDKIKNGQELVKSGDKLIKKGNEDMNEGKQNIEQGNKDTIDGTGIMNENKRIFKEKYPDLKLNSDK